MRDPLTARSEDGVAGAVTPGLTVTLCMGSSCFSRGSAANLAALRRELEALPSRVRIAVSGHLCRGACEDGPTLIVDGRRYGRVQPQDIAGILARHLGERSRA